MNVPMACAICDDTGWKRLEEGGVRRVVRCDCWRDQLAARLLGGARIPRRYQHCDLSSFITYSNEKLQNTVARARRFAESFPIVDKGLFFIGPPGIGKSHLAVAVLKQVIQDKGARGLFYDVRELLKVIRSTYDPVNRTTESEVLQPVMAADLLVLDDLGAEKPSEWVGETLNLIVNTRYNERRATIFTSNYEEKEDRTDPDSLLVRVGARMHSRLHEMCELLEFDGADFRFAPTNAGADDLLTLWKRKQQAPRSSLPRRAGGGLRASLPDPGFDVKWTGGKVSR